MFPDNPNHQGLAGASAAMNKVQPSTVISELYGIVRECHGLARQNKAAIDRIIGPDAPPPSILGDDAKTEQVNLYVLIGMLNELRDALQSQNARLTSIA